MSSATATPKAASAMELTVASPEVVLRLDGEALRALPGYVAAVGLLVSGDETLTALPDKCGFSPFEIVDELVLTMAGFEAQLPLIVAQLNVPPKRALACLAKVAKKTKTATLRQRRAMRFGPDYRKTVALELNGLLVMGRMKDVEEALDRYDAPTRPPQHHLVSQIQTVPDALVVVAAEPKRIPVTRGFGVIAGQGAQLRLHATATMKQDRGTSAQRNAIRLEDLLQRGARTLSVELTKLLDGLPRAKRLLKQVKGIKVSRDGATVRAEADLLLFDGVDRLLRQATSRHVMRRMTDEARNQLHAMARAVGSRRANTGKLCGSAPSVPRQVPKASKYRPRTGSGQDFQSGDANRGWKCLGFELRFAHRYRYSYNLAGNFKGPSRGGPNPGQGGFEVAAEGDLDGDGKTSLFTLTGNVDPATGQVSTASTIFAIDELE